MKLKTLKDMVHYEEYEYSKDKQVSIKELKAEAIKWVKKLKQSENMAIIPASKVMEDFFNITEEDLK